MADQPKEQQQYMQFAKRCYSVANELIKAKFEKTSSAPGARVTFKIVAFDKYRLQNASYSEIRLRVDFSITTLVKSKAPSGKYLTESISSSFGRGQFYFYKNSCKLSRKVEYSY